jgi:hypothetical protein
MKLVELRSGKEIYNALDLLLRPNANKRYPIFCGMQK